MPTTAFSRIIIKPLRNRRGDKDQGMNTARFIVIFSTLLLVLSCTTKTQKPDPVPTTTATPDREKIHAATAAMENEQFAHAARLFLEISETLISPAREQFQLRASGALIASGQYHDAKAILNQLDASVMPPSQRLERRLQHTEIDLFLQRPGAALAWLEPIHQADLPRTLLPRYLDIKARTYEANDNWWEAAQTRAELDDHVLEEPIRAANSQLLWDDLNKVSLVFLQSVHTPAADTFTAWKELNRNARELAERPRALKLFIDNWQQRHPAHPANTSVIEEIMSQPVMQPFTPAQVAVLLPLDSRIGKPATAVQRGIISAYYQQLHLGENPPRLQFYNTGNGDNIVETYNQAIEEGAEFIIGPLTKNSVNQLLESINTPPPSNFETTDFETTEIPLSLDTPSVLNADSTSETTTIVNENAPSPLLTENTTLDGAQQPLPGTQTDAQTPLENIQSPPSVIDVIPTLLLNHSDATSPTPVFQFALSPEEEAKQVAGRAWLSGYTRVITLTPDNGWGQRVLEAFVNEWAALGGEIVNHALYDGKANDFSKPIKQLLNIDKSRLRRSALANTLATELKFEPRRRQDIDFVFMAALPRQARQIPPQFKFHYASDLPIMSTSHAYSGTHQAELDRDMDKVVFPDSPAVIANKDQEKRHYQTLEQIWPDVASKYKRLFAFGFDAYQLIPKLQELKYIAHSKHQAETGVLSMDEENRIHRVLSWAEFANGVPKTLPALSQEASDSVDDFGAPLPISPETEALPIDTFPSDISPLDVAPIQQEAL